MFPISSQMCGPITFTNWLFYVHVHVCLDSKKARILLEAVLQNFPILDFNLTKYVLIALCGIHLHISL